MSFTFGEDYLHATRHPFQGKIYYVSGELRFEGDCVKLSASHVCRCGIGVEYYKDGVIKAQGLFQRKGLVCGRMYYPSGKLRFEGYFCSDKQVGYGPVYPTDGSYFGEDGRLIYKGEFKVKTSGVGYPTVVIPPNFGSLE